MVQSGMIILKLFNCYIKSNLIALQEMHWFTAENEHFEVVQYLCKNSTEGGTIKAVQSTARNGHLDIVKYTYAWSMRYI